MCGGTKVLQEKTDILLIKEQQPVFLCFHHKLKMDEDSRCGLKFKSLQFAGVQNTDFNIAVSVKAVENRVVITSLSHLCYTNTALGQELLTEKLCNVCAACVETNSALDIKF